MASLYRKPIFIRDPKTGLRTKAQSKKWWGRFRDADGCEKRVPLATDRAAAQAMLAEHVRRTEREKVGLIDRTDEHRKRPIAQHLADYRRHLVAKENAPRYIAIALARIKALVAGCRFRNIGDFSPFKVTNWLRDQREAEYFGIATSNDYLVAVKAFCNWLVRDGRLARHGLTHLQRLNAETDVRRQRRGLAPDELEFLISAAERSLRTLDRLTGPDRAIIYRLAAFTGLRAQELASLKAESFDLDASPPTVRVEACYSKHRRQDVLPLQDDLARRLRAFLEGRARSGERIWPGKWFCKGAQMLKHDLASARMAWIKEASTNLQRDQREQSEYLLPKDREGRVVDFHALRHGFITYLVTANVPPKVAQLLARHSTITLTLDRYTHLGTVDLVDALKRLPVISSTAAPSACTKEA